MSKLRRVKIFSYVLPVVVVVFLFSIAGTVLADFTNVYIGKITTVDNAGSGNVTLEETVTLALHNDSDLISPPVYAYIRCGQAYGGYPGALIATAFSSQQQRTRVNIGTIQSNRVLSITQVDLPDDIASAVAETNGAVEQMQQTVDGVYYQVVGQSQMLNGIANLTMTIDQHLGDVADMVATTDHHLGDVADMVATVDHHLGDAADMVANVDHHLGEVAGMVANVDHHLGEVGNMVQALEEHLRTQDGYLIRILDILNGGTGPTIPVIDEAAVTEKSFEIKK